MRVPVLVLAVAASAALIAGSTISTVVTWQSAEDIREAFDRMGARMAEATTKVMRWTSGGIDQELVCTKTENETDAAFAARCRTELDAQLIEFPVDP